MNPEYKKLLEQAQDDENILGLFLGGSRSRGVETEHSDWDDYMIVRDSIVEEYKQKFGNHPLTPKVYSLSKFRELAEYGSGQEWMRYGFSYIKVDIDKLDGEIQKLVTQKSTLDPTVAADTIRYSGHKYINLVYRSIKNHRDGRLFVSHLEAAESLPYFLEAIFALENRLRPYNKYLEWEFKNHPLNTLDMNHKQLTGILDQIIKTGDIKLQAKLLNLTRQAYESKNKLNFEEWPKQLKIIQDYADESI